MSIIMIIIIIMKYKLLTITFLFCFYFAIINIALQLHLLHENYIFTITVIAIHRSNLYPFKQLANNY